MIELRQAVLRNRLLKTLSLEDFALIRPHLRPVAGPRRLTMIKSDTAIEFLHFPEHGFTSVTIAGHSGPVEVGMIGREGLIGATPVLLGIDRSPHNSFIQMPGENLQISIRAFQHTMAESLTLRDHLLLYVQAFLVQSAQTAFANAVFDIEARLCRWLLMCHDRADNDEMELTHDFMSMMLGVRRAGVTVATQVLEGKNLIKATRGRITILDRPGLVDLVGDSYGLPEAEYRRLFAPELLPTRLEAPV